ncbi:MAG: hypothetical protein CVT92_04680 [Bacteroidetes bacterium HGW-Bacteroidetes-1]|jgi:hypothetical protein|nr:MAG: hypothetical protein CVT92_04680 [Bacteroidetes bacterium HGW-Bacteroidetes-1]
MAQTTVFSFFHYSSTSAKWRAFKRMGRPPLLHKQIEGLSFWKTLGVGGNKGFSFKPDFSLYALLTVFDSEINAMSFIKGKIMQQYVNDTDQHNHFFLHNITSHGRWSNTEPFQSSIKLITDQPICVITRATIKPSQTLRFWKYVPRVSRSIQNYQGRLFSKGVGEWPLFMQATFSVWNTIDDMKKYAYQNDEHLEMIRKTQKLGWYKEELFARFHPILQIGNLIHIPGIEIKDLETDNKS